MASANGKCQFVVDLVKLECFNTSFDEEWKVVAKCDKTKGYELRVVN